MRRKDREVTDFLKIKETIDQCHCCRIGFCDNGQVYIVPLNFGYEYGKDSLVFYFHSAQEGRKIELIQSSPVVGFEMDTDYKLNEADIACGYSARFKSIIGTGRIHPVPDFSAKTHALCKIMEHLTGKSSWDFDPKMLRAVTVFRLEVLELSCKEHG